MGEKGRLWTPGQFRELPAERTSLAKDLSPTCRDRNSSVLVHFRLHFLLRGFRSLSLGLEQELLQRGLRARLQGHGLPMAAYGTIVAAELTGKEAQKLNDVRRRLRGGGGEPAASHFRFSIIAPPVKRKLTHTALPSAMQTSSL